MVKRIDIAGKVFGRLTALKRVGRNSHSLWLCRCSCGEEVTIRLNALQSGNTRSCGCLKKDFGNGGAAKTHGLTGTAIYRSWNMMKQRCYNPKSHNYSNYGGRGIRVCAKWRFNFEAFLKDMGPRPSGKTLDRRDNDGNYTPSNCRWATPKEQRANQGRRS